MSLGFHFHHTAKMSVNRSLKALNQLEVFLAAQKHFLLADHQHLIRPEHAFTDALSYALHVFYSGGTRSEWMQQRDCLREALIQAVPAVSEWKRPTEAVVDRIAQFLDLTVKVYYDAHVWTFSGSNSPPPKPQAPIEDGDEKKGCLPEKKLDQQLQVCGNPPDDLGHRRDQVNAPLKSFPKWDESNASSSLPINSIEQSLNGTTRINVLELAHWHEVGWSPVYPEDVIDIRLDLARNATGAHRQGYGVSILRLVASVPMNVTDILNRVHDAVDRHNIISNQGVNLPAFRKDAVQKLLWVNDAGEWLGRQSEPGDTIDRGWYACRYGSWAMPQPHDLPEKAAIAGQRVAQPTKPLPPGMHLLHYFHCHELDFIETRAEFRIIAYGDAYRCDVCGGGDSHYSRNGEKRWIAVMHCRHCGYYDVHWHCFVGVPDQLHEGGKDVALLDPKSPMHPSKKCPAWCGEHTSLVFAHLSDEFALLELALTDSRVEASRPALLSRLEGIRASTTKLKEIDSAALRGPVLQHNRSPGSTSQAFDAFLQKMQTQLAASTAFSNAMVQAGVFFGALSPAALFGLVALYPSYSTDMIPQETAANQLFILQQLRWATGWFIIGLLMALIAATLCAFQSKRYAELQSTWANFRQHMQAAVESKNLQPNVQQRRLARLDAQRSLYFPTHKLPKPGFLPVPLEDYVCFLLPIIAFGFFTAGLVHLLPIAMCTQILLWPTEDVDSPSQCVGQMWTAALAIPVTGIVLAILSIPRAFRPLPEHGSQFALAFAPRIAFPGNIERFQ